MSAKKYELFEHTADVGLYIYGRDQEELFSAAAEALMAQLTRPEGIRAVEQRRIHCIAASLDELLRTWMTEVLYLYQGEHWLTAQVSFESLEEKTLKAILRGEKLNLQRHEIKGEVKAVTWHKLRVERIESQGILRATVVLDV